MVWLLPVNLEFLVSRKQQARGEVIILAAVDDWYDTIGA
jgi:hypothetical protein